MNFIHILSAAALVSVVPNLAVASSVNQLASTSSLRSRSAVAVAPLARAAQAGTVTGDEALASRVKEQITVDSAFAGSQVEVAAKAGVVTLEGVAADAVVRVKIVEKAQATEGVTRVVNKIKIAKAKK